MSADHAVEKVNDSSRMAVQMAAMENLSFPVCYDEILQRLSNCSEKKINK